MDVCFNTSVLMPTVLLIYIYIYIYIYWYLFLFIFLFKAKRIYQTNLYMRCVTLSVNVTIEQDTAGMSHLVIACKQLFGESLQLGYNSALAS